MYDLIQVTTNENQEQVLSGRGLYEFLEVNTRYNDWIKRAIEYGGFVEGKDYVAITQKRVTAQGNESVLTDHVLKLSIAKEISMLTRSEKGKQARQYFIKCEEAWNTPAMVMARANQIMEQNLKAYKQLTIDLTAQIEAQRPKVIFADAVAASHTSILIGQLAKLLKQNGVPMGQNKLFGYLREKGYLMKSGSSWNMPTQRSMEMQLFEIKESSVQQADGTIRITKTTKVTGKGQQYFINHFLNKKEVTN